MNRVVLIFLILGSMVEPGFCQRIQNRSEPKAPVWMTDPPKPGNDSFYYRVTEGTHQHLDEARHACLINLSTYIRQTNEITGTVNADIQLKNTESDHLERETYAFTYQMKSEKLEITSQKTDEYWESVSFPDGTSGYRCFTLFAVGKKEQLPTFDEVSFSRKYGARGLIRSAIVPGWGQFYKGSILKGGLVLGGEVLLIGGIVFCENERVNYRKKIKQTQNIDHILTYSNKADNYRTARNIMIGGAAALYVYSLIDALNSDGRKRIIIQKNKKGNFSVLPGYNGIQLTYNF